MLAEFLPGLRDGYTKDQAGQVVRAQRSLVLNFLGQPIGVGSLTAMYKRPQAEIENALEESTKVYDFDENDKMAWSKLVCFWFADEVSKT